MTYQTTLYDGMLADIYTLTNRPDLDAETAIALRTATTNAHLTANYPRDVTTSQVQLPNSSNQVAFNMSTLFPNCRGFMDIKPIDSSFNILPLWQNQLIEIVEMGDIYDPVYKNLRTNIAFVSGDQLVVRCPVQNWGYAIQWSVAPQTQRALYNSWIAQMAPAIILYWAAAIVLATNGAEQKAADYMKQIEKFYIPQLQSNFLLSVQR